MLLTRSAVQLYVPGVGLPVEFSLEAAVLVTFVDYLLDLVREHRHSLVLAHGGNDSEVDLVWVDYHGGAFAYAIEFLGIAHLRLPVVVQHISLRAKTIDMPGREHLKLRLTDL